MRPTERTRRSQAGDSQIVSPTTWFGYDAVGNLKYVTDALGSAAGDNAHTTWYFYDALNRQTLSIDALGTDFALGSIPDGAPSPKPAHSVLTAYDALGNVASVTDEVGRVTSFVYDNLGRRTEERLPVPGDGSHAAPVTRFGYRMTQEILPLFQRYDGQWVRPTTRYGYDSAGNLKYETDALGSAAGDNAHTTWYFYDALNRPTLSIDPLGTDFALGSIPDAVPSPKPAHSVLTTYDAVGNVTTVTDQLGRVTRYAYDRLDRQIGRTQYDPSELVGYWTLNDQLGATASDSSGNGQNAALVNGPTWTEDARFNGVMAFDGENSYLSVADTGDRPLKYVGGELTLSAWVYIDPAETTGGYLISKPWNAAGEYNYSLAITSTNRVLFSLRGATDAAILPNSPLSPGVWHHVAATVDNSQLMAIYLDGALAGQGYGDITNWTPVNGDWGMPLAIGTLYPYGEGSWNEPTHAFDGKIDDVRIYARALSADELVGASAWQTTDYDAVGNVLLATDPLSHATQYAYDPLDRQIGQTQYDPTGLIANWTLNDQVGSTAWDSSGNGQNASLVNAPTWTEDGRFNGATVFDGQNSYLSVADTGDRPLKFAGGALSLSTWVYIDATETTGGYLISKPWNGYGEYNYILAINGANQVVFSLGGTTTATISTASSLSAGAWHHIVATVESYGFMMIQVDGCHVVNGWNTITDWTPVYGDANLPLAIGTQYPHGEGSWNQPGEAFDGKVDDVRIYRRVVSDAEIASSMAWHTTEYDAVGNVSQVTDPEGNTTTYGYDALDRPTSETNTYGARTYKYDQAGNLEEVTDRNTRVTKYVYDPVNRLVEEKWLNGASHTIHNWYDDAGQLLGITETDPTNAARTFYQYSYDSNGNVTQVRTAPGDVSQTAPTVYSGTLAPTDSVLDWDGDQVAEYYDEYTFSWNVGNVVLVKLTSTAFDPALVIERPTGGSSSWIVDLDAAGERNAWRMFTVSEQGTWKVRATSREVASGVYSLEILVNPYPFVPNSFAQFTYTYDELGNVQISSDSQNTLNEYDYDPLGRLEQATQSGTGIAAKRVDFTYYDDSRSNTTTRYRDLAGTLLVAGTTYGYDPLGRLNDLVHSRLAVTIADYGWSFDAAGRITKMTSGDGTNQFAYDVTDQLTSATLTNETYSYDDNGNRTNTGYATDPENRLLSDGTYRYEYDAEGNRRLRYVWTDANSNGVVDAGERSQISEYAWDHRNRLSKATERPTEGAAATRIIDYLYDNFDRLVRRTLDSDGNGSADAVAKYVYDGDEVGLEFNGSSALTHRYLWNRALDELLADGQVGWQTVWGLADHEGTIRDIINSTGAVVLNHRKFDSFGRITWEQNPAIDVLFAYTGEMLDEATGLQKHGARWYDPRVGRWLSEDPIGFAGSDANLYRYAGNSPLNYVDRTGMQHIAPFADPTSPYYIPGGAWLDPANWAGLGISGGAGVWPSYGSSLFGGSLFGSGGASTGYGGSTPGASHNSPDPYDNYWYSQTLPSSQPNPWQSNSYAFEGLTLSGMAAAGQIGPGTPTPAPTPNPGPATFNHAFANSRSEQTRTGPRSRSAELSRLATQFHLAGDYEGERAAQGLIDVEQGQLPWPLNGQQYPGTDDLLALRPWVTPPNPRLYAPREQGPSIGPANPPRSLAERVTLEKLQLERIAGGSDQDFIPLLTPEERDLWNKRNMGPIERALDTLLDPHFDGESNIDRFAAAAFPAAAAGNRAPAGAQMLARRRATTDARSGGTLGSWMLERMHQAANRIPDNAYFTRVDPKIPGRPDPKFSIDTSTFSGGEVTAKGGLRNTKEFWQEWQQLRPESLSNSNRYLIENYDKLKVSPRIDDEWIKVFPEHEPFKGDLIIHHHVDSGRYAIPVPGQTHVGSGGVWHTK